MPIKELCVGRFSLGGSHLQWKPLVWFSWRFSSSVLTGRFSPPVQTFGLVLMAILIASFHWPVLTSSANLWFGSHGDSHLQFSLAGSRWEPDWKPTGENRPTLVLISEVMVRTLVTNNRTLNFFFAINRTNVDRGGQGMCRNCARCRTDAWAMLNRGHFATSPPKSQEPGPGTHT
jgi:hypothetical protein